MSAGYTERMMGSDSGLSRSSGCPEKCEAQAIRWQNRTGCQGGKVALIQRKAKESACQRCSAKPETQGGKTAGKGLDGEKTGNTTAWSVYGCQKAK